MSAGSKAGHMLRWLRALRTPAALVRGAAVPACPARFLKLAGRVLPGGIRRSGFLGPLRCLAGPLSLRALRHMILRIVANSDEISVETRRYGIVTESVTV